jgi:hypothetical protein
MGFRYRTPALVGHWWPTRREAMREALQSGQARQKGMGRIDLLSCTSIEESEPRLPRSLS